MLNQVSQADIERAAAAAIEQTLGAIHCGAESVALVASNLAAHEERIPDPEGGPVITVGRIRVVDSDGSVVMRFGRPMDFGTLVENLARQHPLIFGFKSAQYVRRR
jgi:hypothetical protein